MCVVSMIGDEFKGWWEQKYPFKPVVQPLIFPGIGPDKEEFDKLKREVELMKRLMKRAKIYDEENGQPDCEMEEKVELIRKIAEAVGVDLDDVLGKKPSE